MQPTAALQRIEMMRCDAGPESNQLTALGNRMCGFLAEDSRGVEAAVAASTHAGHEVAEGERSSSHRGKPHKRILRRKITLQSGLVDQLKFEFTRNKNSMTVFMIRLRRVYRD
jgi:hypothetical protein